MITIYKNEAYLIKDSLDEQFRKRYKNITITIQPDIFNDILKGVYINMVDTKLNVDKTFYIELRYQASTVEFMDSIKASVFAKMSEIIKDRYIITT